MYRKLKPKLKIHKNINLLAFLFKLPNGLSANYYQGVMEDVTFDDQPLGLWNFVYGENSYVGAVER